MEKSRQINNKIKPIVVKPVEVDSCTKKYLDKYPPKKDKIYKPVDMEKFTQLLKDKKNVKPSDR